MTVFLRQEKSKTKSLFLYLLVWNLLITVATAAASSAFRWVARQLCKVVFFFLNLVSREFRINLLSSWLSIPSGVLVKQGYSFCGVITYHLTSLPAQGEAWSSCNERQAGEKKETKQNPWIKTFCSFSVPQRDVSQWPNFSFAFNLLAVVKRAWQRQCHDYLLIKNKKSWKTIILPDPTEVLIVFSLTPSTLGRERRKEEKENAEEEKDRNKTKSCFWQPGAFL